jgi:hypothetical protein
MFQSIIIQFILRLGKFWLHSSEKKNTSVLLGIIKNFHLKPSYVTFISSGPMLIANYIFINCIEYIKVLKYSKKLFGMSPLSGHKEMENQKNADTVEQQQLATASFSLVSRACSQK